jgi:hypothetical protein
MNVGEVENGSFAHVSIRALGNRDIWEGHNRFLDLLNHASWFILLLVLKSFPVLSFQGRKSIGAFSRMSGRRRSSDREIKLKQ